MLLDQIEERLDAFVDRLMASQLSVDPLFQEYSIKPLRPFWFNRDIEEMSVAEDTKHVS